MLMVTAPAHTGEWPLRRGMARSSRLLLPCKSPPRPTGPRQLRRRRCIGLTRRARRPRTWRRGPWRGVCSTSFPATSGRGCGLWPPLSRSGAPPPRPCTPRVQATCYACRRLLTTIGRLGDLGPDQRIYAVRYVGAMAYIVTLRKTDPLCAMSLANPTRMVSLGALKGARVYSIPPPPLPDAAAGAGTARRRPSQSAGGQS